MKMLLDRRWIALGLAMLCVTQVWSKPTEKKPADDDYAADDEEAGDEPEEDDRFTGPKKPLTRPHTYVVPVGGVAMLDCIIENADPEVIGWYRGKELLFIGTNADSKITQDPRMKHLHNNTLVIKDVKESDYSEDYHCKTELVDEDTTITHQLHVTVPETPRSRMVTVSPSSPTELMQGDNLTLECRVAEGVRAKSMHWSRGGVRVASTRDSKLDENTPTAIFIDIRNANRHIAGDYQCLVEMGENEPIVKHIKVRVQHAPEIEYDRERVGERVRIHDSFYTSEGADANISCIVHAHPPLNKPVRWYKDGALVKIGGSYLRDNPHKSHHILTIKNVNKTDLGDYHCEAENYMGPGVGPKIHLRDTPDHPLFRFGQAAGDHIELQWRVFSYKPITESQLMYRKQGEDWKYSKDVKVISSIGKEHIVQGIVGDIQPGKYEAKLRSRNGDEQENGVSEIEWGPFSDLYKFDEKYASSDEIANDAASVKGSSIRPTLSMMSLLLVLAPFAYSFL